MAARRDADGTVIFSKATRLSGHRPPRTGERSGGGAGPADGTTGAAAGPADGTTGGPADGTIGAAAGHGSDAPGPGPRKTAMDDPPVGWLVIVGGPGRGRVVTLGTGTNVIGRNRAARVTLNYGDPAISRADHGAITYDPRGRKYYVLPSRGTNLLYIDDEPVLEPRELAPWTRVEVGNTVLRFVPLCDEHFSWDQG